MKIFIITVLNVFTMGLLFAQDVASVPKHEFTISLSNDRVELKPGDKKDITITLSRSKRFTKSNAIMSISSTLPTGVNIVFEPATGIIERTDAHITVDENAKPGSYTFILHCTMNNKNKGSMLKLIITEPSAVNAEL